MEQVVIDGLQHLQLTKEEEEEISISTASSSNLLEECELSLFGRLLADRNQNMRAFKSTLRSVWKMGLDLRIVDVGKNIFQFKFSSSYQLEWAERNGPWNFDNNLLLLCRWRKGLLVTNISFTHSPLWIQVWGLPFESMTEEVGKDLGSKLGKYIESDRRSWLSEQAKFLRIRVDIPIDKPLLGQVWEMANRTMGEYKAACTLPVFSPPPAPSVWQAPPPGFYKVNVDGAAFDDDRPSCIGVVIRDCIGSLISASSKVLQAPFSAETTETLALQEGVLFASVLGISHVLVESDALSVIQGISGCDTGSDQGHIIQNIKDVSSSFTWCSFQHLKRSGNRAAHDLARAASSSGVSRIWKGICPSFVRHVILEDCGL